MRILLFVYAGLTALTVVGGLLIFPLSAETFGALLYLALPGVLALLFGLRMPKGRAGLFWGIVVLQAFLILTGIGRLGNGEIQGLTSIILPILVLVLVLRRESREHLRG
ncbi:hypothetical protein Nans01_48720 [Nocardiopsis ansamitocini]|uniref:Uncharacterized protein n=1 Tax=Nocardiopsis ansamitocini TaxID=1670832 RepID=A0A9W6UJ34_9ACTN|nr:hypothetical protein [Nocardiopsis ansamitocini]GLU50521.1 hypothetical protein Nans01_48720 [Nocardiopsis ansamitocini]